MKYLEDLTIPHPWYRAIYVEGQAVGLMCAKMGTKENHCRGEIGYGLGFECRRPGIATLAVKMIIILFLRNFLVLKDWRL